MKQLVSLFVILSLCTCFLCCLGCGEMQSPAVHLTKFASLYPLPAGQCYHSEATEIDSEYLAPALFDALYARPDGDTDREDIRRYAVFLGTSLTIVSEMGIFECYDRDCAMEVAGMLRGRIQTIAAMKEADTTHTADAIVNIYGNIVVYLVLPDNAAAERTISRLLP